MIAGYTQTDDTHPHLGSGSANVDLQHSGPIPNRSELPNTCFLWHILGFFLGVLTGTVGSARGQHILAGRKLLCVGGMARKPICPTPPSPSLVAVPGGRFGLGLPRLPCGGGGGPTLTYMAQNDPHVTLIILTTHMWGKFFE